jgi:hypothetical protein
VYFGLLGTLMESNRPRTFTEEVFHQKKTSKRKEEVFHQKKTSKRKKTSKCKEAIILFFLGRGMILLLWGHHQGELDTIITTGTPLAKGRGAIFIIYNNITIIIFKIDVTPSHYMLIGTLDHLCCTLCMLVLGDSRLFCGEIIFLDCVLFIMPLFMVMFHRCEQFSMFLSA